MTTDKQRLAEARGTQMNAGGVVSNKYSFDSQCLVLAELFLDETGMPYEKSDAHDLAQLLQDTVENFMSNLYPDEPS